MKNKFIYILTPILAAITLCSCQNTNKQTADDNIITTPSASSTTQTTATTVVTTTTTDTSPKPSVPDRVDNEPIIVGDHFIYNKYAFSDTLSNYEINTAARALVDAIGSGEDFLAIDDENVAATLVANIYYSYPPACLCDFQTVDGGISISYQNADTIAEDIQAFSSAVQAILNEYVSADMSQLQIAMELYRYVSSNVDYFDVDYTYRDVTAYSAIVNGKAICYGFADCYNVLLRQVGISAELWRGYRSYDKAEHGWSYVCIDGEYYHCDPTWEASSTDGAGLVYFGMNDARRYTYLAKDVISGFGVLEEKCETGKTSDTLTSMLSALPNGFLGPWEYSEITALTN